MLGPLFRDVAAQSNLTVSGGIAYGLLANCFVTLSEDAFLRRISIYVGPQLQPTAPDYTDSMTIRCANQICAAISAASGADNLYCLHTGDGSIPALILNHAGSVVTVNFPADATADEGIRRFLADLLPNLAPLTCPHHCILCCGECTGQAVPVRLSADTVVPMHLPCCKQVSGAAPLPPKERAAQNRAILGAAGGALVAALIWAFVCRLHPLTWILGVLLGLLPTVAYDLLHGRKGRPRMMTILISAACAVVLGSLSGALMEAFVAWKHETTLMTANHIGYCAYAFAALRLPVSSAFSVLLKGLLAGLVTGAVGCIGCFRRSPEEASATAMAEQPRRMKGNF